MCWLVEGLCSLPLISHPKTVLRFDAKDANLFDLCNLCTSEGLPVTHANFTQAHTRTRKFDKMQNACQVLEAMPDSYAALTWMQTQLNPAKVVRKVLLT